MLTNQAHPAKEPTVNTTQEGWINCLDKRGKGSPRRGVKLMIIIHYSHHLATGVQISSPLSRELEKTGSNSRLRYLLHLPQFNTCCSETCQISRQAALFFSYCRTKCCKCDSSIQTIVKMHCRLLFFPYFLSTIIQNKPQPPKCSSSHISLGKNFADEILGKNYMWTNTKTRIFTHLHGKKCYDNSMIRVIIK